MGLFKTKEINKLDLKNPAIDDYRIILERDKERLVQFINSQKNILKNEKLVILKWNEEIKKEVKNYNLVVGRSIVIEKALKQLIDQAKEFVELRSAACRKIESDINFASEKMEEMQTLISSIDHEFYRNELHKRLKNEDFDDHVEIQELNSDTKSYLAREIRKLSYSLDALKELEKR